MLSNVPQVFRSSTTQLRQLKRASKRNFEMKVFIYWPISAHRKWLICCTKEKNSTSISVVGSEKAFEFKNTTSNRFPRLHLRVPSVRTPATSEVCLDGKVSLLRKNCCQRLTKEPTPFASFSLEGYSQNCTVTNSLRFFSKHKVCLFEDFNGRKSNGYAR